jgi:uncharacterized protein Yka (UPF0111/DUF47 family)
MHRPAADGRRRVEEGSTMAILTPFARTRALEARIDEFLDRVSEGALIFQAAARRTLEVGRDPVFLEKVDQLRQVKRRSSGLRREIETELYTEMLIPDLRGDVATLIESLHDLIQLMQHFMRYGRYEKAQPPEQLRQDILELIAAVVQSVEGVVLAARAFFRSPGAVRDHVYKVGFHESEADRIADRLCEAIFDAELDLARKIQVRDYVMEADHIADFAEEIADDLTIYALKRSE